MNVVFYTFTKKRKSMKLPDVSGTTLNCKLKDPTTMLHPDLLLTGLSNNPTAYNYAYISAFNRYYRVRDWESDHNLWIAHLDVDRLASWRTDILNTYQHVLRSASKRDTFIDNSKYVVTTNVETEVQQLMKGLSAFPFPSHSGYVSNMTYVLEVSNNSPLGKVNGLQYLALTSDQIKNVMNSVLNDNNNFGWGTTEASYGLTAAVSRAIVNPLQYFGNCYMLPFAVTGQTTTVHGLKVGFWTLDASDYEAIYPNFPGNAIFQDSIKIRLKSHPESNTHGQWLNSYPYMQYEIYAGPFGRVTLNANEIIRNFDPSDESGYEVTIDVRCDMFGKACMTVYDGTFAAPTILAKAYANVAVPFSLTQTKNDILSWGANFLGAAASIWGGNVIGSAYQTDGLISSIDKIFPKPDVKGQNSSALCDMEMWTFITEIHHVSCEDQINTNLVGDPLCQVVQLSSLSGFCQTDIPWLPLAATSEEIEGIAQDLQTGVYIE